MKNDGKVNPIEQYFRVMLFTSANESWAVLTATLYNLFSLHVEEIWKYYQ